MSSFFQQLPKQHHGHCLDETLPWLMPLADLAASSSLQGWSLQCWCTPGAEGGSLRPSHGAMALLVAVAQVLLLLGLAGESQGLCSPTAFYKNCWIRRFPGLLLDLRESQRRGAQLLKGYAEISSQQCSRTCCLLRNGQCLLRRSGTHETPHFG